MVPRLLVSVRDPAEALAAAAGGADIIDVKEPARGSLGLADLTTIAEIQKVVQDLQRRCQLSIALGELTEWSTPTVQRTDIVSWSASVGASFFAKAGPAHLSADPSARRVVQRGWQHLIRQFQDAAATRAGDLPDFVCVAYADYERSESPAPLDVLDAGIEVGCQVFLVDTWQKDGSRLTDWLADRELVELRHRCTAAGLQLALAGRIDQKSLPQVLAGEPDIIGVRGIVCREGERTQTLTAELVERFCEQLKDACAAVSG